MTAVRHRGDRSRAPGRLGVVPTDVVDGVAGSRRRPPDVVGVSRLTTPEVSCRRLSRSCRCMGAGCSFSGFMSGRPVAHVAAQLGVSRATGLQVVGPLHRRQGDAERGVDTSLRQEKRRRYLTAEQLEALADAAGARTGRRAGARLLRLRWSEPAALRLRHSDLLRRPCPRRRARCCATGTPGPPGSTPRPGQRQGRAADARAPLGGHDPGPLRDLFDDDLDDVADRLDALQASSRGRLADCARTEPPRRGRSNRPRR